MKKFFKPLLIVAFAFVFFCVPEARASVIMQQADNTTIPASSPAQGIGFACISNPNYGGAVIQAKSMSVTMNLSTPLAYTSSSRAMRLYVYGFTTNACVSGSVTAPYNQTSFNKNNIADGATAQNYIAGANQVYVYDLTTSCSGNGCGSGKVADSNGFDLSQWQYLGIFVAPGNPVVGNFPTTFQAYGASGSSWSSGCTSWGAFYNCGKTPQGSYVLDTDLLPSGYDTSTASHISNITPSYNSTTSSTSVTFSANYYVNFTDGSWPLGTNPPTGMCLDVIPLGAQDASAVHQCEPLSGFTLNALTRFNSTAVTLPTGTNWQYTFSFYTFDGTTGVLPSPPTQFWVVTNNAGSTTAGSCGITSLGTCITNALSYLFTPSTSSVAQFRTLTLSRTFPFSYLYDVPVLYSELFVNTGSMDMTITVPFSTFGNITLLSPALVSAVPFTSTIKTVVGYMIWFFTAMFIFNQVKRSHH